METAWSNVWQSAIEAAQDQVEAKASTRSFVRASAQAREERLRLLLVAWADQALDQATLESELKEERDVLSAEFLAVRAMTSKAAQAAANALLRVINKSLIKGIDLSL